ncbi:RICIN domain-containing protein [Psychroserpens jangbogonensis]|uniref:RICIN domain-containing protein n=1 Tax=Psychroserpens jangbogonensis TaxID=1484460 RepID=UPI00068FFC71|nr:RICIN domain-containing protein [Psychroserpens jangbogonensis]
MKLTKTLLTKCFLVLVMIFPAFTPYAQNSKNFDTNAYYRLTTEWLGEGKSLDVVNDANDNKLILAKTDDFTGQLWKITPLGNGFFRLTTKFKGEGKSLDVYNDGKNNRLQLAKTAKVSGQFWKIQLLGNGYYRLTTQWQGDGKSLDVINDGKNNNEVHLAKSANHTGQYWKIQEVIPNSQFQSTTSRQNTLKQGQSLTKGSSLICPNKSYELKFQTDGNLAFYGTNGRYIWDSKTNGIGETCKLKSSGNLVILDKAKNVVWSSKTSEHFDQRFASKEWKPVKLVVNDAGFCGLKSATGREVWYCNLNKTTNSVTTTWKLKPGESLKKGSSLISPNRNYELKFQSDGNLSFYGANDRYIWDSKTNGVGVTCKLKSSGNLVIFDRSNNVIWSSKTSSHFNQGYGTKEWKPVKLIVTDAGFCGLKSATGKEVWYLTNNKSNTTINNVPSKLVLKSGESLKKGESLTCPNRSYELRFQLDGNLAFYGPNGSYIWDAKTNGKGETCILQTDGNLVIYDKAKTAVWSTETMVYFNPKYGTKQWRAVRLVVKDSGFCGLKSATGQVVWTCVK